MSDLLGRLVRMAISHEDDAREERGSSPLVGTVSTQNAALNAVRHTGSLVAGANLLEATGPLAELTAAETRGVLDAARRELITKKGRGVVFEAATVVQLQEAGERYGFKLSAQLSSAANNPRADVLVTHAGSDIELQLKCGDDKYIRAALRKQADDIVMLVPSDAAQGQAVGVLDFDGVEIEAPTRDQLYAQTEKSLDRLSAGEPVVSFAEVAKRALKDSLVAAVIVAVIDLTSQVLEKPEQPIDWKRTGKAVLKVTATTVATSLLATANTAMALKAAGRAIEVASIARGARAAAALVPHAIDVAIDFSRLSSGEMNRAQFVRKASGHAGAATAEYLAFPVLARIAARLGPIGSVIAMIAGGLFVSFVGRKAGEFIHDMAVDLLSAPPAGQQLVEGQVSAAVERLQRETEHEIARRVKKAEKRLCEEPRCSKPHHARGMCKRHYGRWWRRQRRFNWRAYSVALPLRGRPTLAVAGRKQGE